MLRLFCHHAPAALKLRGQALIFGLFALLAVGIVLVAVFNVGQVAWNKMRLVNTADAAVYSGAVWQARSLNYMAYTNRSMIANEIALAQVVSLVSWTAYAKTATENIATYTSWIPYVGQITAYIAQVVSYLETIVDNAAAIDVITTEGMISLLKASQAVVFSLTAGGTRGLMEDVIRLNDPNARIKQEIIPLDKPLGYGQFIKLHKSDQERQRLANVVVESRDGFTTRRNWDVNAINTPVWKLSFNKRGGTDLIGLNEWKGVDTLAAHESVFRCRRLRCRWFHTEVPIGWGAADLNDGSGSGGDGEHGGSAQTNPNTHQYALSDMKDLGKFSGIPQYFDVSDKAATDPRLTLTLEVAKGESHIRTSSKVNLGSGRLALLDDYEDEDMQVLSKAEIFFKRYTPRSDGRVEYGSLFNPYWQARLVKPTMTERLRATGGLGGVNIF